jgi:hypothetical protein
MNGGGSLEDDPCPDQIESWTVTEAAPALFRHLADNRIKGLILGADGDILLGQDGQKPFEFMFTWQMQRQRFEEVAISPEPGEVNALCRECKMFVSNNFHTSPQCFVRIYLAILIHQQPAVY